MESKQYIVGPDNEIYWKLYRLSLLYGMDSPEFKEGAARIIKEAWDALKDKGAGDEEKGK